MQPGSEHRAFGSPRCFARDKSCITPVCNQERAAPAPNASLVRQAGWGDTGTLDTSARDNLEPQEEAELVKERGVASDRGNFPPQYMLVQLKKSWSCGGLP